ncbi:glycosyltransferase [Acidiphilium sp. PA]|uniref:glycosyltransferase n=1 Tax=Acidiphilium sp. PA TaxID=2871705 RepID=UPI0022435769|nr:glycosyltransferase [Acidiphilium sp. PA]MCW8306758.1 glycosyltransferase [Acidiphilium sp. PA]
MSGTLTVVIPTLNEAPALPGLLALLARSALVGAVVISDGGSTDGTVAIAASHGAIVVSGGAGRGAQVSRGIAAAPSAWLLLLHADALPQPGWDDVMSRCIASNRPSLAWYGRLRLASADPRARLIEYGAALRCALLRLPYGDQALLIHRDTLTAIGGMPTLPLMEDVALARRLGRARLAPCDMIVLTDAAAYARDGWLRRSLRNLARLARFLAGADAVLLAAQYRR